MEMPPLEILYEDNHCLAIAKPAGVTYTAQGSNQFRSSLNT